MESPNSAVRTEAALAEAHLWWSGLTPAWKQAFNEVALQWSTSEPLPDDVLLTVHQSTTHRFAGPRAPYPNLTFELTDLSGVANLPNTEILVVVFHQLTRLWEVSGLKKLRSLFVYDNQITALDGVEGLTQLEEIYFNVNDVRSLKPLQNLTNLHTVYAAHNQLDSFEGIGEQHADRLDNFFVLPNPGIRDSYTLRFEREVGIRCKKG